MNKIDAKAMRELTKEKISKNPDWSCSMAPFLSEKYIPPISSDKAIKLTTALYFTPNGRSIQAEGIIPDLWVDRSTVTKTKSNPFRLQERDLPGHLNAPNSDTEQPESAQAQAEVVGNDYQLNQALTILKGLHILAEAP